jgi:GDP-L-fucose synthase
MNLNSSIFIAGHNGMVGSAIHRKLLKDGYTNIITRSHSELDLTNQAEVNIFFTSHHIEYVFLAAAKVGGILANNTYRAEFIYKNLMIEANVIHASYLTGVKKLVYLGSSCIYPKGCPQPIKEEYLLTSELEYTNQPYAIAKIAGIELCESYRSQYGCNFISLMPTNLYGPNDSYHLHNSHVLPALLRKCIEAKRAGVPSVELWGTGQPLREFLHVDDLAEACVYFNEVYNEKGWINVGSGVDISIKELALLIKDVVGYKGELKFDTSKPDGTMKKCMDVSKAASLGWKSTIGLREGIQMVYNEIKDREF